MIKFKLIKNLRGYAGALELLWHGRATGIYVAKWRGQWQVVSDLGTRYPRLHAVRNTRGAAMGIANQVATHGPGWSI